MPICTYHQNDRTFATGVPRLHNGLCRTKAIDTFPLHYANTPTRYTEDDAPANQEPAPEVKIETAPAVEVKAEEPTAPPENSNADGQTHGDEQDADDDIDFNLGNGNGYSAPANQQDAHGPGIKEDG